MISKKLVLILSLCAAGSFVPLHAAVACVDGNTVQQYINAGSCTVGNYTFTFSSWVIVAPSSSNPNDSPPTGLGANDVTVHLIQDVHGTGFELTPIPTWGTNGAVVDSELKYLVTSTSAITNIYARIDGTVAPNGYADVDDLYCLGSTLAIQTDPCPSDNNPNTNETLHATIVGIGTTSGVYSDNNNSPNNDGCAAGTAVGVSGCQNTGTAGGFNNVTSIAVQKDIRADASQSSVPNANAYISDVYNQFGPAVVPEPGTILLSFIGLGLLFLGKHRFSRS